MKRSTKQLVARGILFAAALCLHLYISHEEALFECPLKSPPVFIMTHLPQGARQ